MADGFLLKVVTPTDVFLEKKVASLIAPGALGYFGVLKNHAPYVTTVSSGNLTLRDEAGRTEVYKVSGGFFEVRDNRAVLLTDSIAA